MKLMTLVSNTEFLLLEFANTISWVKYHSRQSNMHLINSISRCFMQVFFSGTVFHHTFIHPIPLPLCLSHIWTILRKFSLFTVSLQWLLHISGFLLHTVGISYTHFSESSFVVVLVCCELLPVCTFTSLTAVTSLLIL